MRTILQICFLVCYIFANAIAQQWVKVISTFNPPGNYNTYHGVFVNEKDGWWIAGPNASILHTYNGGLSWQNLGDGIALGNIEFKDTVHGWMVGRILPDSIYNILITKDGGKSWDRYSVPAITCLTFFDSLIGFAGGDSIYKTTDGGVTWQAQMVEPSYGFGIMDISFVDKKYGWAVGGSNLIDAGVILNTVDSGKTWQFNDSLTTIGSSVYFTDSLHGYIAGSNPPFFWGMIKMTNDGGKNWLTNYLSGAWMNDVVFTDDSIGWCVGNYGFIGYTTNQGMNWYQVESGTTSHLYRIFFFDNGNIGYIIGADSTLLKYEKTVSVKEEKPVFVTSFKVFQNYPNPFNPTTNIEYNLSNSGKVTLKIYNILGEEVRRLVEEYQQRGRYKVTFNARGLPSGVYFYNLVVGDKVTSGKMILSK